jgi:thiamine-monophosphate kinase
MTKGCNTVLTFPETTQLIDIGERRLVSDVLAARYGNVLNWGDDAALVSEPSLINQWVVATTDPCPPPMAVALGFDDWFFTGWLLATINLSDLAAAGATPGGLLSSLILPPETRLRDFLRLLDGLDQCCGAAATRVIGGNLKEAPEVALTGTAIGFCATPPLSRSGARAGDDLWLLGDIGRFWAGVLGIRGGIVSPEVEHPLLRNVLTPPPRTADMSRLAKHGVVNAAIDTSDGLYPALAQLSLASNVGVTIDIDSLTFRADVVAVAEALGLDPLRLALGWGDWQILFTSDPFNAETIRRASSEIVRLGVVDDEPGVRANSQRDGTRDLSPLDSERFVRDSWFSAGLEGYIQALTTGPLYQSS